MKVWNTIGWGLRVTDGGPFSQHNEHKGAKSGVAFNLVLLVSCNCTGSKIRGCLDACPPIHP